MTELGSSGALSSIPRYPFKGLKFGFSQRLRASTNGRRIHSTKRMIVQLAARTSVVVQVVESVPKTFCLLREMFNLVEKTSYPIYNFV